MFNPFKRPSYYRTPSGTVYTLLQDMAARPHLLIAGATGSGKSTLLHGIVGTLLFKSPSAVQFVLCDPKRVELRRYARLPHTICYAGPDSIAAALVEAVNVMEQRFTEMERRGQVMYDGSDIYVIIDELADLMLANKKLYIPLLQRLVSMGRAAKVHVIACTVNVTAITLPAQVRCCFDSKVGLRTATRQDSRNIMDMAGCEALPDPISEHRAQCYYRHGSTTERWNIPDFTADAERLIAYWSDRTNYIAYSA